MLANNRMSLAITFAVLTPLACWVGDRGWRAILGVVICAGATVYVIADPSLTWLGGIFDIVGRYTSRGQTAEQLAALSGRTEMWTAIWESYLQSPWIGHGYFVTSSTGELYVWFTWANWTAHNLWLQTLATTGLVGAALLAWGLLKAAACLIGGLVRQGVDRRLAGILGVTLAWHAAWGLANESFVGPVQPESVVFFVIIGAAIGLFAKPREQP
jgi:O-antigen ligase